MLQMKRKEALVEQGRDSDKCETEEMDIKMGAANTSKTSVDCACA